MQLFGDESVHNWLLLKGSVASVSGALLFEVISACPSLTTGFVDLETDILVHFSVEYGGSWL